MVWVVVFEESPSPAHHTTYLSIAASLKPGVEETPGFISNIYYRSLTRAGWMLSVNAWRDEEALISWRNNKRHHGAQEMGRQRLFLDYHLRVGEVVLDTKLTTAMRSDQKKDGDEDGNGTVVVLVNATLPPGIAKQTAVTDLAMILGCSVGTCHNFVSWDVFESVAEPGNVVLLCTWLDTCAAEQSEECCKLPEDTRMRRIRVVRDYGMYDRGEAPQSFRDVERPEAEHP